MKSQKVPLYQLAESGNTYVPPSHHLPVSYTEQITIAEPAHFSVFRLDENPGNTETEMNRHDLYRILLLTKGRSQFRYAEQTCRAAADSILFLKPAELRAWKNIEQDGYYCNFTQPFLKVVRGNPLFSMDQSPVLPLNSTQATLFRDLFIKLHQEFNNILEYNIEMLRLYLHIMLIEAGRAHDQHAAQLKAASAAARLVQRFQQLLEEEAGKVIDGQQARMRTVKQLADQLTVHAGYLNSCVKSTTGKTARQLLLNSLRLKLIAP